MNVNAKVAMDKAKHPERYCPEPRCLWKTAKLNHATQQHEGGGRCPRHGGGIGMPATMQQIGAILESEKFDGSAKWVIKWQFRLLGHFETALAEAITRADESNLEKLEAGFPVQVKGFRDWAYGTLGEELRAAGLPI